MESWHIDSASCMLDHPDPGSVQIMTNSRNTERRIIRLGAIVCGTGILLGAFGAHALEGQVGSWYTADEAVDKLASWKTGVLYQLVHGLAILWLAIGVRVWGDSKRFKQAALAFLIGVLLFSCSLYVWVITDLRWLVMIVPVGGVSFVIGWLMIVAGTFNQPAGNDARQDRP